MIQFRVSAVLALAFLVIGSALANAAFHVGGRVSPDGKEVVKIDYPAKLASKNTGGTDGAGLCVFTSVNYCAHWQNERLLQQFQKQMEREKGGGWPEKLDEMIARYAPGTEYLQYEGRDMEFLSRILKTSRMVAVTFSGADGRFYKGRVAHMVVLVHLSERWACIRDNNFVGENQLLWMTPDEFLDRWTYYKTGWAVVLFAPPPPPVPTLDESELPVPEPISPSPCPLCPRAPKVFAVTCEASNSTQRNLWWASDFVGRWDVPRGEFYGYSADRKQFAPAEQWSGKDLPNEIPDYGVRFDRLQLAERYNVNGRQVTRAEAEQAFGAKQLPNDASCLRITVTGKHAEQVAKDVQKSEVLAPWRGKLVVQAYPEGAKHWHLNGLGFPESGIVVQEPPYKDGRGRVIHQQEGYGGPEQLEQCLRNCDPKYQPSLAPDLTKWFPVGGDQTFLLVALGVGSILLVFLWRKK